jgi:basic membrane protein A
MAIFPTSCGGGLADNFCKLSAYGPAVSEEAKAAADAAKEQLIQGELIIYSGGLKDNSGNVVVPEGEGYKQDNIELEKMDYLIEGVQGSIDG